MDARAVYFTSEETETLLDDPRGLNSDRLHSSAMDPCCATRLTAGDISKGTEQTCDR